MEKNVLWKWGLLAVLLVGSLMLVTPVKQKVKLGLDLQGGISFIVQVDKESLAGKVAEENPELTGQKLQEEVDRRVIQAKDNAVEVIRNRVDTIGIAEPNIYPKGDDRIIVQLPGVGETKQREARDSIMSVAFLEFRLVHQNNDEWVSELFEKGLAPRGFKIRTSEDQFYVRDPDSLPDSAMDRTYWTNLRRYAPKPRSEMLLMKDELQDGSTVYRPTYVESRVQLTGDALKNAMVEYGNFNEPRIALEFNSTGARDFARVTKDYGPRGERNIDDDEGRRLGIVLDGTLYSAPVIRTPILDGRAEITGVFSLPEANRLVNVLRAGSLPAPVTILEERQVSPSLGRDSINSGVKAAMYGLGVVVIFMLLYYKAAGLCANIGLLVIMLLLPVGMWIAAGFLSILAGGTEAGKVGLPVITLPGIAGIVLTIGMAVDAAVIIFERIREEHGAGKQLGTSIQAGYEKAFSAILDANVTTILTAVILFWQGSGPVRGFAVTLSAGIIMSMLVALVYMRSFLNISADLFKLKSFGMLHIVRSSNVDFLGKRFIAVMISLAVIGGSWFTFFQRGDENFNVDFTGGTSLMFSFDERQPAEAVREVLNQAGVKQPTIQYQKNIALGEDAELDELLDVRVPYEFGDAARESILEAFADAGFELAQTESIGPQIGKELKKSGITALVVAMLGIVIYLTFRFEFAFAIGAIVAVFHDVLMTIGIYCLMGEQISLPIVAALLTIIGYSVNDTIIIFDRIREDLKLYKGRSYIEICNLSINQTLSRTILTSLTTLITVSTLLIFGGGAINDFALALAIGIITGTYSTIFIATPVAMLWHREKAPQKA